MPRWGVALLLCGLLTRSASAQEPHPADVFFREGVALADQGQWERAAQKLRLSLAARASDRTEFNLARALAELGEVAESSALLRGIVLDPGADLLIRDAAEALLAVVAPRVSTLRVEIRGSLVGRALLVDERPVDARRAAAGFAIDPGRHAVAIADTGGVALAHSVVTTEPGEETVARLTILEQVEDAGTNAPSPLAEVEHSEPITSEWWFWGGAGALAAAAIVVGVIVASAGPSVSEGNVDPVLIGGRP